MSCDFPKEAIFEGEIKVIVPKLAAFINNPMDYAPSKAPVFYNPTMELNRDLAVLALQTHQRRLDRELTVCEPMTGCGLRGIRFAVEIEGIKKVSLNDINPIAIKLTNSNVELNKVHDRVLTFNENANLFLNKNATPRKRFDYIDIDPFGTPVIYFDSSIRALRDGGMLALTATDMAPLCGVHPRACIRKYGGIPLRTEYCHELAVRLMLGCLTSMAAKHDIGMEVVFSHSIDHYIRAYSIVHHGAKKADKSVKEVGYILHCFSCFHREIIKKISSLDFVCPLCNSKLSLAGP